MSKKSIILTKHDNNKPDVVYIRMQSSLKEFVDSVAKQLGVTRSEAIRRLLEGAKDNGIKVE